MVFGLALAATASCVGLPTGPSLDDVTISNLRVQPTIGDPALCCCHVVATARNNNSVAVHATIKFVVLTGQPPVGQEIARTVYFIENFRPGTTHNIDAPGFTFECNRIGLVTYELSVRGLTAPAP